MRPRWEHTMKNVTATNKDNELQVEMMMGKAMCAYANWKERKSNKSELAKEFGKAQVEIAIAASQSEYEATVRCIDMFVKEHLPEICRIVIDRCAEEFGI